MLLILFLRNNFLIEKEKISSFECGYDPFFNPRSSFSIQFFKIILIFLLFDVEIILIFPLPLFQFLNYFNNIFFLVILRVLILGLYFEWKEGSLKWLH